MPESLRVLLDQNVPRAAAVWLRRLRPSWTVRHATEVSLAAKSDREIFAWAQAEQAAIVTFDEDFADQRSFPVGEHHGVVRLGYGPPRPRRPSMPWNASSQRYPMTNWQGRW